MSVLDILATALEVPLRELTPEASVIAATGPTSAAADLSLALSSSEALLAVLSDSRTVDLDHLSEAAAQAWDQTHGARYDDLATLLSALLPELEYAVRRTSGVDRVRASHAKAKAYHAAAAVLSELGEFGAAWVAVDRAITAAEDADDPLLMAEGAFRLTIVFQRSRRFDLAGRTASSAIAALAGLAGAGEPEAVALRGAMYLQLAVTAARTNDADAAYEHLARARESAAVLGGDRNDYDTEFGPTNVALHEVHVALELGDAGRALRVAASIDGTSLSPERQARLLVDVARAHAQRRQPADAVAALRQAEAIAPEQVRSRPAVRKLLTDALHSDYGSNPELRELVHRLKII
jgi:tetratricopeptide (TPR) repeat protein